MIRRISTLFVPVAQNLYKIREQKDAAGDFFRSLQKQKSNYQGFWIATPEGKLIAAHQNFKDHKTWTSEVLEVLDGAIKDFGPVEPRAVKRAEPLPHKGAGRQPDGSYCLAVYFCVLYNGKREAPPDIDSIILTSADMSALAPDGDAKDFRIPDAVARKFSRAISASSDTSHMPGPEDVTSVEMTGKVESVEGGVARIRLAGKWEATKVEVYDPKKRPTYSSSAADGVLTYDLEKKEATSLLMVFGGKWRNVTPYDQPVHSAAVVEWKAK